MVRAVGIAVTRLAVLGITAFCISVLGLSGCVTDAGSDIGVSAKPKGASEIVSSARPETATQKPLQKISLQNNSGAASAQTQLADFLLTREEAQTHACPQAVLEVGASDEDCQCAEDTLFALGQDGDLLKSLEGGTTQIYGDEDLSGLKPRRVTAIEILRLDAFESCGFFEEGHPVGAGL